VYNRHDKFEQYLGRIRVIKLFTMDPVEIPVPGIPVKCAMDTLTLCPTESSYDPALAALDTAELQAKLTAMGIDELQERKAFVNICIEMLGCMEKEAVASARNLELSGSDSSSLPFMKKYCASYNARKEAQLALITTLQAAESAKAAMRLQAELEAHRQSTANVGAIIPFWPPSKLVKEQHSEVLGEVQALRFLNEQLLLRVDALEKILTRGASGTVAGTDAATGVIPTGSVMSFMFGEREVPEGWTLLDGRKLSADNPMEAKLAAMLAASGRSSLPDARGRFILGAGKGAHLSNRMVFAEGGLETVALSIAEMPQHSHTSFVAENWHRSFKGENDGPKTAHTVSSVASGVAGGNAAHENMPPFLAMNWIVKL
jgi:microcystin-dependent protein